MEESIGGRASGMLRPLSWASISNSFGGKVSEARISRGSPSKRKTPLVLPRTSAYENVNDKSPSISVGAVILTHLF